MFDTILGLPVHALVVHAVVVLVPLGAVGVIAMAVVPRWRERFGVAVLAILTIGLLSVPVATQSGKKLQARLNAGGVVGKQIKNHMDMGKLVIYPTAALWILAAVLLLMNRRGRGGRPVTVVALLAVLAALAAGAQVAVTGHLGSVAAWSCTIGSSACK
ncbi:MAG: hypothetical protein QOH75_1247 [Actinomycetota bacterium]|jgi:hypothetical protein|nr:hypothetical protein [Actinomycetota bacterium]